MARRGIDPAFIDREIRGELHRLGRAAGRRLMEPTRTWNHRPQLVVTSPVLRGNDLVVSVRITDDEYYWLDGGTDIRYATMTHDFKPKTQPGSFGAAVGAGGLYYVSKWTPHPGIEARNWTVMASTEYQTLIQQVIDRIMQSISTQGLGAQTSKTFQYTP